MMDKLHAASRYLRHRLLGVSPHGVHSPFVFDLFNKVILDETPYYFYEDIETLRSKLLLSNRVINVTDFGTGARSSSERKLKLSYIAKNFLQSKRNAQLISRLATHLKAQNILELGSSLGITSLYLALPDKKSRLITLEGCPETAKIAEKNFKQLGAGNIELINHEFDISLPEALKRFAKIDLIYFDGNHKKDATIKYFELCLAKHHDLSLFIFDDIHWSREMSEAWSAIIEHPEVTISVDLFHLGLIFFRKGLPKQHFNLKF